MNKAEILYQSNSLISFTINDELFEISNTDPRFGDIKINLDNPKQLLNILTYSIDGLSQELISKIVSNQNFDFSILKNIYFNLSKKEHMLGHQIIEFFESRIIIPINNNGIFLSNAQKKTSNQEIIPSNFIFNLFKNTRSSILTDYFPNISNKQQIEITEILKENPELLLNIYCKFDPNPDKIKSFLEKPIFIGKNYEKADLKFIIKFLNFMYEKKSERLYNHLSENKIDLCSEAFIEKAKTLFTKKIIHPKTFNNISELVSLVHSEYNKFLALVELQELNSIHPIITKLLENELSSHRFIIPSKAHVISWGSLFNNCFAGRNDDYISGKILLFGLENKITNKLEYVGEFLYNSQEIGDFETFNKVSNENLQNEAEILIKSLLKKKKSK